MEFLKTAGIALLFFVNSIVAGALGIFHFAPKHSITATPQISAATTAQTILDYPNGTASGYTKDQNYVYFASDIIPDADPTTFEVLKPLEQEGGDDEFAVDKSHVFFFGFVIPGADPATFEVLDGLQSCGASCVYEARDRNHNYYQNRIVN